MFILCKKKENFLNLYTPLSLYIHRIITKQKVGRKEKYKFPLEIHMIL